jgi:hypothetical protein
VTYVSPDLPTCGVEVFGDAMEALVCPHHYAALVEVAAEVSVQNIIGPHAMALGAYHYLGSGNLERTLTHEWARAIAEDKPAGPVSGILFEGGHDGGLCYVLWETAPPMNVVEDDPLRGGHLKLFIVEMQYRSVPVTLVPETSCRTCRDHGVIDPADFVPPN